MRRSAFVAIFFGSQLLFVLLQIHKHILITSLSYHKLKRESDKMALLKQKQDLINQWYQVTDPDAVKTFAEEHLHLKSISLTQVKKISHDKQTL
jgi:hypothetical protein